MGRKKIVVKKVDWRGFSGAEGLELYLDEFDTREEAEEELHNLVMEYVDYSIKEIEE